MPQPFPNHTPDNNDALVLPNRRSAKASVRAIVRDSSTATGVTVADQAAAAASVPRPSQLPPLHPTPHHPTIDPLSAQPETVTGKGVLLEGTARVRTGLAWFKPTHVQLLAAPASDGTSCEPAWSALVVGGVAMPYEELAGVQMDESVLEFVVAHKPRTTTAQDDPPPHYLRMYTRSEFNLWREALGSMIDNPTLPHAQSCASISAGSNPSAYHAAQKWLRHAEDGAALRFHV